MTEADPDVLRTIIREELHAVLGELETARVRRSEALEELARLEQQRPYDLRSGLGGHNNLVPLSFASGHGV